MSAQNTTRFQKPLSPEVLRRLELSRRKAARIQARVMQCPICGFPVSRIPVNQTDIVFARCRKCKFTGPLDPAYFRRVKRRTSRWRRPENQTQKPGRKKVWGGWDDD